MKKVLYVFISLFFIGCGFESISTQDKATVDALNEINSTLADQNTSVIVDTDVNNTVYPPVVEVNNTVVFDYGDIKLPVLGSGTFSDPYILRQAIYSGIPKGLSWFLADNLNVNCTISAITSVRVDAYQAYNDSFTPIANGVTPAYGQLIFDINSSSFVIVGLSYSEANATTLFAGSCLAKPVFYR